MESLFCIAIALEAVLVPFVVRAITDIADDYVYSRHNR